MDSSLGYVPDLKFRELVSPVENEVIKSNVFTIIKLTKTVSEFCGKLAVIKENTASSLLSLVDVFRRKTSEVKKRPDCQGNTFLTAWDQILAEVESEAKDLTELGQLLQKTVANPLSYSASRKKALCKKSFAYRDACQTRINKNEDDLYKKYKDYSDAWFKFNIHDKETLKDHHIAVYHNRHNEFLLQLATLNSMNETLYLTTAPEILDDVEKVHKDMNKALVKYLKAFLNIQKDTLSKLSTRMTHAVECANKIDVEADLRSVVQHVDKQMCDRAMPFRQFFPPKATKDFKSDSDAKQLAYLKKSLVVDQYTEPMLKRTVAYSRKKISELDLSIQRLKAQIQTSEGVQDDQHELSDAKEVPVDEVDVLLKRNQARDQNCQLQILHAQMSLVTPDIVEKLGPVAEEYAQDISKDTSLTIGRPNDTTMLTSREKPHHFVEHNFLKPAQCYYCRGIIVGLVKQGFKCQSCRMNVHKKCKANVPFCTGSAMPPKQASVPPPDEHYSDECLYAEIEPGTPSPPSHRPPQLPASNRNKPGQDYEAPQPAPLLGRVPTGALPPRGSVDMPLPDIPQELLWVVALYDFEGEESHDLNVSAGEKIQVLGKSSDEWWEGICHGEKGYFPAAYVMTIKEKDKILKCLYTFEADEDSDEMALEEGEILVLVEDEGNGWTVGRTKNKTGAFPSTYVEEVAS
eukprot:gene17023-18737_t